LSEYPIPMFAQGHYFAVRVTEIDHRSQGGLGLGVTSENFSKQPRYQCPAAASEMQSFTGICAYYGSQLRKRGRFFPCGVQQGSRLKEPHDCDWRPQDLHAGDEVGCLARPDGSLSFFINGELRLHVADAGAPSFSGSLFAVVDILGHCVAVQAMSAAHPPISCERSMSELNPPFARPTGGGYRMPKLATADSPPSPGTPPLLPQISARRRDGSPSPPTNAALYTGRKMRTLPPELAELH